MKIASVHAMASPAKSNGSDLMDSEALGDSFLEVASADAEGGSHVAQAIEFSEAAMHRATQLGEAEPAVSIAKYDANGHLIARAVEEVD